MTLPGPTDVGVIVGRFQVPELHKGHRKLFDIVMSRHRRVLVLLGVPAWIGGLKNPLDYNSRKQMVETAYPTAVVLPIKDQQTNEAWSKSVDSAIRSVFPLERITLYGGRKGFTSFYRGELPTVETLEDPAFDTESGEAVRDRTSALPINSSDFRSGVIYAAFGQPTGPIMCVDGAVTRDTIRGPELLLIRKPNELKWRFPGGKLERTDLTLETAVNREVREETGVEVGVPHYICSGGPLPDWRAEQNGMAIYSSLYHMPYIYGAAHGTDDAAEAKWFLIKDLDDSITEPCHTSFMYQFIDWYRFMNGIQGEGKNDELPATNR